MKNTPSYFEAKPNPLFTDEQTALVRFIKFQQPVACAHCNRKRKAHWTSLVPFRAIDMDGPGQKNPFVLNTKEGPLLSPLTPVCHKHILAEDTETMEQMILALRVFFNLTYRRLVLARAAKRASPQS